MKKTEVKNNVENNIRSILHGVGRFSCSTGSQEKVLHHRGATLANAKGITLIALVITIIVLLILAGITISLTIGEHGILNMAKEAGVKTEKEAAREKLELALLDLQAFKVTDETYNDTDYIEDYLQSKDITLEGDIAIVDNWQFEIDRETLEIKKEAGQAKIRLTKEVKEYTGKNANGKYEVKALLTIESGSEIASISILNPDGTTFEVTPETEKKKIEKDIQMELDQEYVVTINTVDGEFETKKIVERSTETIRSKEELVAFGNKVNAGLTYEGKTVNLVTDIDLEGSETNRNWEPIGDMPTTQYFAGVFEGNNHKIFNLYNKDTTGPRKGLFGCINKGTVQNLGIENGHVMGGQWAAGGIVGRIEKGKIINCYNKAKIEVRNSGNSSGNIGGIVGVAFNSTISECYNEGEIKGTECNGGIMGSGSMETKIFSCYNEGSVIGEVYTGGIVGHIENSGTVLNNCYNKGNVTGGNYIGGIVGDDRIGTEVKNCYNIATVTAPEVVGGVIGRHMGMMSNLFFLNISGSIYVCGTNDTDQKLEEPSGSTEATLKGLTDKLNEGQADLPWKDDEDNINGGYPILSWQKMVEDNED